MHAYGFMVFHCMGTACPSVHYTYRVVQKLRYGVVATLPHVVIINFCLVWFVVAPVLCTRVFICFVISSPGTATPTMVVPTTAVPGPVNNLRVTSSTATTLTITWTVSGSIDRFEVIYTYTVNRCLETGEPETVPIAGNTVLPYTLRGLNEDSSYTITVRVINTTGSTDATTTGNTLIAGRS